MPTETEVTPDKDILGRLFGRGMTLQQRQRWDMACLISVARLYPYLQGNPSDPVLLVEANALYRAEDIELGPETEIAELLRNVRQAGVYEYLQAQSETEG